MFSSKHIIEENLALRPLSIKDAGEVFLLVEKNREHLAQYLYWVNKVVDVNSTEQYIKARIESELPKATWFAIEVNNKLCGIFGVKSVSSDFIAEVGYWLCSSVQGKGVMSQIVRYINTQLKQQNVKVIEFRCLEENKSSIRVAQNAGASLVKVEPNAMKINQQLQSLLFYHVTL
ncbi:GNAT family N-acetyltransferase [Thalassotalea sp. M1531]|uniref:GNAT family N-acetyltransferase n=1 Tax=Thalassotalea algicola TaxID=2716224 RepID=A0A7Y0Q6H3_9GAMM|nr:GNAT family protein [Thalassotalea algicola]NMP30842.1 GNAT family N-acetyltransferase [Thalassotalea algicola]